MLTGAALLKELRVTTGFSACCWPPEFAFANPPLLPAKSPRAGFEPSWLSPASFRAAPKQKFCFEVFLGRPCIYFAQVTILMESDFGIAFRMMRNITPKNTPRDGQAPLDASAAKWHDQNTGWKPVPSESNRSPFTLVSNAKACQSDRPQTLPSETFNCVQTINRSRIQNVNRSR